MCLSDCFFGRKSCGAVILYQKSMTRLFILIILSAGISFGTKASEPADSLVQELKEVVVTAGNPATKLDGSKLVTTIAGTPLRDAGSALDVLAHLPMLKVDGVSVSVTGRGTPEIYIDGRPLRSDDELTFLQSDNMRKVELLLAPGAEYGSNTAAVLKIYTRRNIVDGLSFTAQANARKGRRWSAVGMLDVNYRAGKWDFFASAVSNRDDKVIKGSTVNILDYEGRTTVVGSRQNNSYRSFVLPLKAGFNYSAGEQSFGAYYRYNPERGRFFNSGTEWLDSTPEIPRDISRHTRCRSHLGSVYYDNTFGNGLQLHFDGDFKTSVADNSVSTVYRQGAYENVDSHDIRKSYFGAGKLYISCPLWGGDLTAGTQESFTHTSLDYKMMNEAVEEYLPSSLSDSRQISAAVFAAWSRKFGKLNLSAGLRYEYVDYRFKKDGITDSDISRQSSLLTPDISVGFDFGKNRSLTLSYKASTVKPPYSQLTGSLSYVGQHEIEGGNPSLRDERMHDIQLFGMWGDFFIQADVTRSIDTYAFVKKLYPAAGLQLIMQPVNIDVSALDMYMVWQRTFGVWTPDITLGLHKQWLKLGADKFGRPIFSLSFDNVVSLPSDWLLTAAVDMSSAGYVHTNRFGAIPFTMNMSVSKSFFHNALQLRLSATDIFNTANNDWKMYTFGVSVNKRQSYDRRSVTLSVTYRFRPQKSKYKGRTASEEEMRRL